MTTKVELFEKLDRFPLMNGARGFAPASLRLSRRTNFGLDREEWVIWITGEMSADETLVMGTDILPVQKYVSFDKAQRDLIKFRKWFDKWKSEQGEDNAAS